MEKIRLGISTCLLGKAVRYDGGHKLDIFLRDTLGQYIDYVPVCPEVECGLGVPREAMRLVADSSGNRLVTIRSGIDHTEKMLVWARVKVSELEKEDLCGFIFKSGSPSSGMERVKVYGPKGIPLKNGVGLFASIFMQHFPLLPVEDEGRLNDPSLRENFIERIFALMSWRESVHGSKIAGAVVDYHTRNKLLILSHSPKHYQTLGRLVAESGRMDASDLKQQYENMLMEALRIKATPAKHANVLQHMLGYFKDQLTQNEKQEMLEIITSHRQGVLPLIVPITLLQHYVRRFDQPYLKQQTYVHPHPLELKLRNHV